MNVEPPGRALIKRWEALAEKGDASAQASLGATLATGDGVELDDAGAVYWYAKAANQGDVTAKWNLATMILNGEGISRNEAYALRLIEEVANEGQDDACRFLAYAYAEGIYGKPVDPGARRRFERKAEEKSHPAIANAIDIEKDLGVALKRPIICYS